jgi:hypothetical protein
MCDYTLIDWAITIGLFDILTVCAERPVKAFIISLTLTFYDGTQNTLNWVRRCSNNGDSFIYQSVGSAVGGGDTRK